MEIYLYVYLIYICIYIHRDIYIKFVHIYNIIGQLSSRVKSQLFFTCSRPYLAPPFSQFGFHPSPIAGLGKLGKTLQTKFMFLFK